MAANCEVIQGLYLIVELLLPSRNPVQIYLWWQYLRIRYKMDRTGSIKNAFSALDTQLNSILSHRYGTWKHFSRSGLVVSCG